MLLCSLLVGDRAQSRMMVAHSGPLVLASRYKDGMGAGLRAVLVIHLAAAALAACGTEPDRSPEDSAQAEAPPVQAPPVSAPLVVEPPPERVVKVVRGISIWYGDKWHGIKTASGEIFDENEMTAAHRSLPFGTRVRVTNLANDRRVIVRITDRGPFGKDRRRIIDVSKAAARELGFFERGSTRVQLEVLADEEAPLGSRSPSPSSAIPGPQPSGN
jgi:rare lipoprotein A